MGAEVFYFVSTGTRTGDERINLVDGAREEVVFAANFLPGGEHVTVALTAAHHHFVDGGFGKYRSGDATGDTDAANTDKGFVGIDFGKCLQGKFSRQRFAALVDFAAGQDNGDLRVMGIVDGIAVVGDEDDAFIFCYCPFGSSSRTIS